jgi:hypothetical protein
MPSSGTAYLCAGFYPLAADDVIHAARLFALWKARRTYGPAADCRLLLQTDLNEQRASFEALIAPGDRPGSGKSFHFAVVIDRAIDAAPISSEINP